ncbi:ABC-type glutathione transport system ATPase component [Rhizobium aethiopicum]|uniref:ABC-type glutathione transport system ATPase component n=1 Tax=Rhizobium aethiopicum TaxID=1138170 RepID=A0A7W6MI78_9HYPH|nr:ABC-type glutathione transport system ATPase component [Rhizobium aethiopicum]
MVDASLRMAIVNLFGWLRNELGVSIIYITHDLGDRLLRQRQHPHAIGRDRRARAGSGGVG